MTASQEPALQERLLLRPKQVAEALAISARTLFSLTASGAIQCVRIGRSLRYEPASLRAYVESLKGKKD